MTAHVTIEGFRLGQTDWEGRPLAKVGDTVTLVLKLWNYANLKGGKVRINHPAMAAAVVVDIPKRKGTGKKSLGLVGNRAATTDDLAHEDNVDCAVVLANVCDVRTEFTLTAVENCVAEPAPSMALRCVADDDAFEGARLTIRQTTMGLRGGTLKVAKASNSGGTATHGNTVAMQVAVFAELFFKDPEGVERPFPRGMSVKVLLGDHPDHALDATVGAAGALTVHAIGNPQVLASKKLTLRFGDATDNQVLGEVPGATAATTRGPLPGETDPTGTLPARVFTLPATWTLRQADWTVTADDGRWKPATATFDMVKNGSPASLGTSGSRVRLVLDPHWQFLRFEYFDRRHGHASHGDAPKTMPAVMLEGFTTKPTLPTATPDVRSNWWIVEGGETVQCVPWIVQRSATGTAHARPSRKTLLRFTLPARTCMHATSATVRTRVIATAEQLKPGPARLDFYDLPTAWNSRNYYAKLSTTAGEFGWYEDIASKPTTKAKPLVFSLDDVVLTDENGRRLGTWDNAQRLAVFVHTFDDSRGTSSKEGVWKPDDAKKTPWLTEAPAAGAPEENENYVVDLPKWTRLITAQGNLFDVFDKRTVESSPADPDYDVVGARAAVRWVDAPDRIEATEMWEPDPTQPGYIQMTADHKPAPGRQFEGAGVPSRKDFGAFVVQPYYAQDYMARFGKYLDAGSESGIGRFDMALLRCCDVEDVSGKPTERAINLYYHRLVFDGSAHAPVGMALDAYQVAFTRNVMDRFNGLDAKNSLGRALLVPKDATKAVRVQVVAFLQVTPEAQAHFRIKLTDSTKDARDWRSGADGTGETSNAAPADSGTTNGFVNAHEHGHQSAWPDEYNERWDAASYGQPSFYSTLPGDPYELDGRTKEFQEMDSPLMNGNHKLHNRYFWQSAEWARLALGFELQVKLGGTYDKYWLPPYDVAKEARRHLAFWPITPSKNDTALPARGRLTVNRGKVDLFLYAIGADAFAVETLPAKEDPPGADPYDGILMVNPRIKVGAWGVNITAESDLRKLAQSLALVARRFGDRKLNHSWAIRGEHATGTRQEWKFKRCLVHFSPRVCISGNNDLEDANTWNTRVNAEFRGATCWTTVHTRLVNFHAAGWDAPNKGTLLDTLIGPVAEPVIAVRSGWNDGAPAVAGIQSALGTLEGLPLTPVLARYNQAQALVSACDGWLGTAVGQPNRRNSITQLRTRAEAARITLGALFYTRNLEDAASKLKSRNTDHEAKVTEVTTAHAPHFTVTCTKGTAVKAEWDPLPVEGDLPDASAWESTVPTSGRSGGVFNRVKGLLTQYKSKEAEDLEGRIEALKSLVGPATLPPFADPRGSWTAGAKPGLATLETKLGAVTSAGDHATRITALEEAGVEAANVASESTTDPADVTAAQQLGARITTALDAERTAQAVRKLESHATVFRDHLQRWIASTTVTLTADTVAGFEDAMLLAFPSMVGAYTPATKIAEADIRALAAPLGLANLKIIDLRDDG